AAPAARAAARCPARRRSRRAQIAALAGSLRRAAPGRGRFECRPSAFDTAGPDPSPARGGAARAVGDGFARPFPPDRPPPATPPGAGDTCATGPEVVAGAPRGGGRGLHLAPSPPSPAAPPPPPQLRGGKKTPRLSPPAPPLPLPIAGHAAALDVRHAVGLKN